MVLGSGVFSLWFGVWGCGMEAQASGSGSISQTEGRRKWLYYIERVFLSTFFPPPVLGFRVEGFG